MEKSHLLPPFAETHRSVRKKASLDRSSAGTGKAANLVQRSLIGRAIGKRLRDFFCSGVDGSRQLKRHVLQGLKLIEKHTDEMGLRLNAPVEGGKAASVQNEFPKQGRNVHNAAVLGKEAGEFSFQVQRSEGDRAHGANSMGDR